MLLSLGLRVVVPDCMGYGRTVRLPSHFSQLKVSVDCKIKTEKQDAPRFQLRDYGFKRVSDDMAELAKQLGADRIILGGHDW